MSLPNCLRAMICPVNLARHRLPANRSKLSGVAPPIRTDYATRPSAPAIRRRAASDGIISVTVFRRGCQFVLQSYRCRFIQEAVRTRTISQLHVANLPRCLPPFLYSGESIIESVSHPRRTAFSSRPVSFSPDRSRRAPEPKKRGVILRRVGKGGVLCVNRAGIVTCSRATTARAWCCILLLSKKFL